MTIAERRNLRIMNERVVTLEKENRELKAQLSIPELPEPVPEEVKDEPN